MPEKIGPFHVLGTLGQGAHSTILHIRRASDGKSYALKVVTMEGDDQKKFLDQARHEFRVAQMLQHPNIIQVPLLELHRNWLFRVKKVQLLIEYVNGLTLDKIPRLSVPRLLQIFEQITAALVHMHRRGVFHADLKPNNVMLSRAGVVKVIDLGLAWIKHEPKLRVQGTPEYMAPEQFRESLVNEQTDIYNLGATMYRLATWRLPPKTLDVNARAFATLLEPVEKYCHQAPPEMCDLIMRCLSFKPEKRPQRVSEIQAILQGLVAHHATGDGDPLEGFEF